MDCRPAAPVIMENDNKRAGNIRLIFIVLLLAACTDGQNAYSVFSMNMFKEMNVSANHKSHSGLSG
jgi:hypothetical protein